MTGETLPEAVRILEKGGLVIYPTETCYGLGADATDPNAVEKVYALKKRAFNKPLSIIVSSLEMIKLYAVIPQRVEELVRKYMPGPLTLIVKNEFLPDVLCGGGETVGFRIPDHPIALELVKQLGKPITATSANVSGKPNPYTVPKLKVDFVINYGQLPKRKPSTVYDTIAKKVLRKGPVDLTKY